jgi:hypothetical protein
MNVHVVAVGDPRLAATVAALGRDHGHSHHVTDDPADADLVLVCGNFSLDPGAVLAHPLRRRARRFAVYSGDDNYLPLVPGAYASPRRGLSTWAGRVRGFGYAASYGVLANDGVARAAEHPSRHEPHYLFTFEGGANSRVRRALFRSAAAFGDRALVRDTTASYRHFGAGDDPDRRRAQDRYAETIRDGAFALCPRGVGTGTLRLYEAMRLGVAPVVVADGWVPPSGPDWGRIALFVAERDVARLVDVLEAHRGEAARRGAEARRAWEQWFAPEVFFDRLVDAASAASGSKPALSAAYLALAPLWVALFRVRRWMRRQAVEAARRLPR